MATLDNGVEQTLRKYKLGAVADSISEYNTPYLFALLFLILAFFPIFGAWIYFLSKLFKSRRMRTPVEDTPTDADVAQTKKNDTETKDDEPTATEVSWRGLKWTAPRDSEGIEVNNFCGDFSGINRGRARMYQRSLMGQRPILCGRESQRLRRRLTETGQRQRRRKKLNKFEMILATKVQERPACLFRFPPTSTLIKTSFLCLSSAKEIDRCLLFFPHTL